MTMGPNLDPRVFPQLIEYFPDYRVLFCHCCKSVYFPSQLDRHLATRHHIEHKRRQPVVAYCQTLPVAVAAAELALGEKDSRPVPFLPLLDGFACQLCPFYSTNYHLIRGHLNKVHQLQRGQCDGQYHTVKLQSWYTEKRARYCQVQVAGTAAAATAPAPPAGRPTVTATVAETLEQLEEQECRRLEQLTQDHLVADTKVEVEETSPWLNVTECVDWYESHNES
ncbi:hypothetical protein DL95DRAFT_392184 [Leptodontidium sp. 2 PMI_412]|nr:hypothetical protein DL95DRAFT_392184 [Leptodontidium sp. 2 PMI_412]